MYKKVIKGAPISGGGGSGEGGSVEVVNNLTSSKTDAALSAAMGKKLNDESVQIKQEVSDIAQNIFQENNYNIDNLVNGGYYSLTANYVPNMSNMSGWRCLKIEVKKGQELIIKTKGGNNARAYALTDENLRIITVADANFDCTTNPITLDVVEDGYLVVNCLETSGSLFYLSIQNNSIKDLKYLSEKSLIEINGVKKELDDAQLFTITKYNQAQLISGYYNLVVQNAVFASSNDWRCLKIEVKKSQVIKISTKGGNNARAYALTDENLRIITVAESSYDCTTNPDTIIVENNGYLIVNCLNTALNLFNMEISGYTLNIEIEDIKNKINKRVEIYKYFENKPLPKNPDKLKILAIGNSYTIDGTSFLPKLLAEVGLSDKVAICILANGGKSLEWYYNEMQGDSVLSYTSSNNSIVSGKSGSLKDIFASENWDIIVFQQVSNYASKYETISPYLPSLLKEAVKNCQNPNVSIAYQSTWAWGISQANWPSSSTQIGEVQKIIDTANSIVDYGLDIIIPSGMAVQNARQAETENLITSYSDLTRDNSHLDFGVGRYVAACAWFQKLITPIYGISVVGNSLRVTLSPEESANGTDVTDNNALILQKCARNACIDRFNIDIE